MKNFIAVCPKCEKIHKINDRIREAWCQHYISNEDGTPDKRFPTDKHACKIVMEEKKEN